MGGKKRGLLFEEEERTRDGRWWKFTRRNTKVANGESYMGANIAGRRLSCK